MSAARQEAERCRAVRSDGQPCRAAAGPSGFCIGHHPNADANHRKGGHATRKSEQALRLLPARLRPVADLLEQALGEVYRGELEPKVASAMASLAAALCRIVQAGEVEERLRSIEQALKAAQQDG
jgi:hypothetical protein